MMWWEKSLNPAVLPQSNVVFIEARYEGVRLKDSLHCSKKKDNPKQAVRFVVNPVGE